MRQRLPPSPRPVEEAGDRARGFFRLLGDHPWLGRHLSVNVAVLFLPETKARSAL